MIAMRERRVRRGGRAGRRAAALAVVAMAVVALAALAGCPASQVGHVEGPHDLEDPTAAAVTTGTADGTEVKHTGGDGSEDDGQAAVKPLAPLAPPADRDADGIADAEDPCPDGAELMNGYQDDDGCPDDPPRIVLPAGDPAPVPSIPFAAGRATLAPATFPLLDGVVAMLQAHPEIRVVEVQGHVDGTERAGKLDVARAEAVRAYLVVRGVDAARLTVKGYGATRPLDPARTDAARERNRRVELSIAVRVDDPAP
jgi:outer membrane protein OmpA-like peptidoglycan-associated protein